MSGFNRILAKKTSYAVLFIIILVGLFSNTFTAQSQSADPGYALDFDGVNDYVRFPSVATIFGNGNGWKSTKTISLWVKPAAAAAPCSMASPAWCDHLIGDRPRWWGISIGAFSGQDAIWVWNFNDTTGFEVVPVPYTANQWVNITMVHGNGTLSAYKNGVLVGSIPSGPTSQPNTSAQPVLQIGGVINTATRNWTYQGQIDEVSVWDRALSQAEIQTNMNSILTGSEAGLRAYYRMSNGSGSVLTDDSSFNWDGTLLDGGGIVPPNGTLPLWVPSGAFNLATPTPTFTSTTEVPTETFTPVPPTETPTDTPEVPTDTPTDTPEGPTNTPTDTPEPPTETPTDTPEPPTATATNTPIPPTSTNTPIPPTPTNTLAPGLYEVGSYLTPGDAWDVVVRDQYAYIGDVVAGMRVVDISNPTAPIEVGAYDTPGRAYAVALSGNYAYVADGRNGLQIIDITNPLSPTWVSTLDTPEFAWGIAVSGQYAYIADRWGGVRIINVTDPAHPAEVASITTPDQAVNVAVDGSLLYVVAYEGGGLLIYNIANPAAPVLLGSYNTPGGAFGVAVSAGRAYIADGTVGLVILDVSNPAAPTLLGQFDTPGLSRDITFSDNKVFIADEASGMHVVNVSNPSQPLDLGMVDTPGQARGIAYQNGYAYVADYAGGLRVMQTQ